MNEYRFLDPSQPATLQRATLLAYFECFFGLIGSGGYLPLVVVAAGLGAGGFGLANGRKWGYATALIAAILNVVLWIYFFRGDVLGFPTIISFAFAVILVVLLAHPMSREYRRIWFS